MRKTVSGVMLTLLLIGVLAWAFNIQPVEASGTIYIRADGSIDPPAANITSVDNVTYTFTDNNYGSIVVERGSITIDGNGYVLQGSGKGIGFYWIGINNVTIKNTNIKGFNCGVYIDESSYDVISRNNITNNGYGGVCLYGSSCAVVSGNDIANNGNEGVVLQPFESSPTGSNSPSYHSQRYHISSNNNVVSGNNITGNRVGVRLYGDSDNNVISGNKITNNRYCGVYLEGSGNNVISGNNITNNVFGVGFPGFSGKRFYHNNFVDNAEQVRFDTSGCIDVWDDGYPSSGNYWSDYADADLYCGPNQDIPGNDGVWDHPYVIDSYNNDSYPLVKPYVPGNLSVSISTDKAIYHAGEKMRLGIDVSNPDSVKYLCFAIGVTLPDSSVYVYMHKHSVILPIGLDYANSSFQVITLPNLTPGKYTWHAAFLERTTHTLIVEDTAEWQFS